MFRYIAETPTVGAGDVAADERVLQEEGVLPPTHTRARMQHSFVCQWEVSSTMLVSTTIMHVMTAHQSQ